MSQMKPRQKLRFRKDFAKEVVERENEIVFRPGSAINSSFGFSNLPRFSDTNRAQGKSGTLDSRNNTDTIENSVAVVPNRVQFEAFQGPSQFASLKRKRNRIKPVPNPNGPKSRFAIQNEEEEVKHAEKLMASKTVDDAKDEQVCVPATDSISKVRPPTSEEPALRLFEIGNGQLNCPIVSVTKETSSVHFTETNANGDSNNSNSAPQPEILVSPIPGVSLDTYNDLKDIDFSPPPFQNELSRLWFDL